MKGGGGISQTPSAPTGDGPDVPTKCSVFAAQGEDDTRHSEVCTMWFTPKPPLDAFQGVTLEIAGGEMAGAPHALWAWKWPPRLILCFRPKPCRGGLSIVQFPRKRFHMWQNGEFSELIDDYHYYIPHRPKSGATGTFSATLNMIRRGCPGKAFGTLVNTGPQCGGSTLAKLRLLYPDRPNEEDAHPLQEATPRGCDACPLPEISASEAGKAFQKMSKVAAAGFAGHRVGWLKQVFKKRTAADDPRQPPVGWFIRISALHDNDPDYESFINVGALIAVNKKDKDGNIADKPRPINVGDPLSRVPNRLVMPVAAEGTLKATAPFGQFACGARPGAEKAHTAARVLGEDGFDIGIGGVCNAFNSAMRGATQKGLGRLFQPDHFIHAVFHKRYGKGTRMHWRGPDDLPHLFIQWAGARQGDVWAMLFFCVALMSPHRDLGAWCADQGASCPPPPLCG